MNVLFPMGYDETYTEACARAMRIYDAEAQFKAASARPQEQDSHIILWERIEFEAALADDWKTRQEEALYL